MPNPPMERAVSRLVNIAVMPMDNARVPDPSSADPPPSVTTVALQGALDLTTKDAALANILTAISERHHVDVDMSAVTSMDSTALSMFIRVHELAAAEGLRLRLTKVRPLVQRALQTTGVQELLTHR